MIIFTWQTLCVAFLFQLHNWHTVVMYGCESWTVKKAEHQRIDAFELWCWRRLESPLDCKEIQLGWRKHKLESRLPGEISITSDMQIIASWLRAGGEGDDRGWDGWMTSPTQWTWIWVDSGSWWWTGRPGVLQSMGSQRDGHDWATELNWTTKCVYFTACTYNFLLWTCVLSFSSYIMGTLAEYFVRIQNDNINVNNTNYNDRSVIRCLLFLISYILQVFFLILKTILSWISWLRGQPIRKSHKRKNCEDLSNQSTAELVSFIPPSPLILATSTGSENMCICCLSKWINKNLHCQGTKLRGCHSIMFPVSESCTKVNN